MLHQLCILPDFIEETWPSMELCADMLTANLPSADPQLLVRRFSPRFRRRFGRLPGMRRRGANADRFLNRLWDYPRQARRIASQFDLFHLVDHSYSQLIHELPSGRVGIYCHDLDTFRCLLDPKREPRPRWFRAMARRILTGLQKAAVVFHSTAAVRDQIEAYGLLDESRLVHAPNGVAPEFSPDESADDDPGFPRQDERPFLLHVGSCIARKRIDVLLEAFARVRVARPRLRLIQAGGEWTRTQQEQIRRLGIGSAVQQVRCADRTALAKLYRRAALVLVTSEAEGFGLPVIEALACGSAVIASDIPPLREVGGDAVVYCRAGEIEAWSTAVLGYLDQPERLPVREQRIERAGRYSWAQQARTIALAYRNLLETGRPTRG